MRRLVRGALLASCSLAPACAPREAPPRGQLLIHVDTDAPLALASDEVDRPTDPAPLFDQMRIEILDGAKLACDGCRRDFPVDRRKLADEATSFGVILPPGRGGLTARVRLFRAVRLRGDGEPPPGSTIEETFALPPLPQEGIVERTAFVSLARVGAGSSSPPAALTDGRTYQKRLFPGVVPTSCSGTAGPGEVCVPGGAFWMTNAEVNIAVGQSAGPERVVVLSPFWMDAREVTVGEIRRSGIATASDPVRDDKHLLCTYASAPDELEDHPVTCISHDLAAKYCQAQGKALPTEAQFEFVASATRGRRFPWGDDPPTCNDAIYGRPYPDADDPSEECVAFGRGTRVAGSGRLDFLVLPGGRIQDLAGNAQEHARDSFALLTSACWASPLAVDPVCLEASAKTSIKGGGVNDAAVLLRATTRGAVDRTRGGEGLGFRCVRDTE